MTTALSTSRPKLEIDGRPISRLLSGVTPSAHPLSHFALPLLHPPPSWKASSSFIAGETRLFWAGTGGGTRRSRPRDGWLPAPVDPNRGAHQPVPPPDRHLFSHGRGVEGVCEKKIKIIII